MTITNPTAGVYLSCLYFFPPHRTYIHHHHHHRHTPIQQQQHRRRSLLDRITPSGSTAQHSQSLPHEIGFRIKPDGPEVQKQSANGWMDGWMDDEINDHDGHLSLPVLFYPVLFSSFLAARTG
jgi:hypothetical protein